MGGGGWVKFGMATFGTTKMYHILPRDFETGAVVWVSFVALLACACGLCPRGSGVQWPAS